MITMARKRVFDRIVPSADLRKGTRVPGISSSQRVPSREWTLAGEGTEALRDFCGDWLCSVLLREANVATGAPDKVNDYSQLQVKLLTTNQVVGSSNLSGRAK